MDTESQESMMNFSDHFDIAQQSRDAVAVIRAAGEDSAFVFGSSSGAVIALDMATTQAQAVRGVIAHEPPLARVHPNSERWKKFFQSVYETSLRLGNTIAMLKFAFGIGIDYRFGAAFRAAWAARQERVKHRDLYLDQKKVMNFFIRQEMLPVTNYEPDLAAIQKNNVKIVMAAGKRSLEKKRFYAETPKILAEKLNCEFVLFPGHHASFIDLPDEWASTLKRTLTRMS